MVTVYTPTMVCCCRLLYFLLSSIINRPWSMLINNDQYWSGTINNWREQKIQQTTTTDHCGSVYSNHCLTSKGIDQWYLWFVLLSFVYWQCFTITVEIKITTRESVSVYDRYWYRYVYIYHVKSNQILSRARAKNAVIKKV